MSFSLLHRANSCCVSSAFPFLIKSTRERIRNYSYKIALSEQSRCNKERSSMHGTENYSNQRKLAESLKRLFKKSVEQVYVALLVEGEVNKDDEEW